MNVLKRVLGWLNKYRSVFLLSLAAFLLFAAQSSFWINQTIFDQATFTAIASDTLKTEESRQALATTVVDKALADRPVVKRVAGEKATQLVTGLLGTDLASQTIDTVINKSYSYLTSPKRDPIEIDLLPIKTPLAGLVSFAESQGREVKFDPAAIPDSILIFDPSNVPSTYGFSAMMLWVGPLCWLGTLGLFGAYIYRGRRAYAKRVYIIAGVIIATCLAGLMTGPIVPAVVSAHVPVIELRSVVNDLIGAMLAPFARQMYTTIGITLIVVLIFSQRRAIARLVQRLLSGVRKEPSKQAEPAKLTKKSTTKKKSTPVKKPRKKS